MKTLYNMGEWMWMSFYGWIRRQVDVDLTSALKEIADD